MTVRIAPRPASRPSRPGHWELGRHGRRRAPRPANLTIHGLPWYAFAETSFPWRLDFQAMCRPGI
ncbi:hypothetical protein D3869_32365 (plasmid) [Azospirillum brasilense]|uniref:Uncharacterized protein n=1 Tax=Azospirillum brasilense TaxID=192 RepID=A0A4D8RKT6_AZOBR|nr:hypothetical protein D3869_32365 [Azospirillum brasilense]